MNDVTIRPAATDTERDLFFRIAAGQFIRDAPPEIAGPDFRRFTETAPGADPAHVRGAFRGEAYLGGYLIDERWLRIGAARLRTGCVGVVTTRPEYRGRGVATALMNDAFAFARSRGCALLMLHGLADFYEPWGYVDVFDAAEHRIAREDILQQSASPYRVRPAMVADAPEMVALYDRHFGPHPGNFLRSVEHVAFQLEFAGSVERGKYLARDAMPFGPPVVAVDADGCLRGYLFTPWGPLRAFGNEVAVDDWPAMLALLQHDARQAGSSVAAPTELRWPLPTDGLAAMLLADRLTVRVETLHRPRANWMAALVDLAGLVDEMRTTWNERIQRIHPELFRDFDLVIDGQSAFRSHGGAADEALSTISLSAKVLVPLLFGYRNARWAMARPGTTIDAGLEPVLEALFPPRQPWIAPTDGC